jgi:general secretion pathway protein A
MYLTHFGLHEKPFKTGTDPKYLWLGEKQREALANLAHRVLEEGSVIVVTGDVGAGKTTFTNALLSVLEDRAIAAKVTYPDIEGVDFLKLISKAYGQGGGLGSKVDFFDHFASYLRNCFLLGKPVVLIIDDAQRLTSEYLAELFRLSDIQEDGTQLLSIAYVGQNEFKDLLSKESDHAPGQPVAFSYKLEPLTKDETVQYIACRLNVAHCERELFTPGAIDDIFSYSKGVPRLINMVCNLSLNRTFFKGEDTVRPETVKECVKMLRIPEEKTLRKDTPAQRLKVEATAGSEPDEKILDDARETIAEKSIMKPHWVRAAYAAVIVFLVVSVGFTIFLMQGKPPDSANMEAKKEVAPPASPVNENATTPSGDRGQDSELSTRQQTPGVSTEDGTLKGANIHGARTKKQKTVSTKTSAKKAQQALTERSRQEKGAPEGAAITDDTRRGNSAERGGAVSRDPTRQDTEKMESSEVIDWLIKKRSEQK